MGRFFNFSGSKGGRYYRPKGYIFTSKVKHMLRERLQTARFQLRTGTVRIPDLRYNRGVYRRRKYMGRHYRRLFKRYRLRPKKFFYSKRRARNRGFSRSVRLPTVPVVDFRQTSNNFIHMEIARVILLFTASAGTQAIQDLNDVLLVSGTIR